jgi:hypothetical protein
VVMAEFSNSLSEGPAEVRRVEHPCDAISTPLLGRSQRYDDRGELRIEECELDADGPSKGAVIIGPPAM